MLGICGWSGAGKTTLIEGLLPGLVGAGLRVAVVKHDAHGLDLDRPGKDSDRLHRAGADVWLTGPGERCARAHRPLVRDGLDATLLEALADHDLVLVEGHKGTPIPKLWLVDAAGHPPPAEVVGVLRSLPREGRRVEAVATFLDAWLAETWRRAPVLGGILIGGRSTRMGLPKQMLASGGRRWIDTTLAALRPQVSRVVLLGDGDAPPDLEDISRLPDPPDGQGPLNGLRGALRWAPLCTWVIAACDMPRIAPGAIAWLLDQRRPGVWAVLPEVEAGRPEPLFALYDHRVRALIEEQAARGRWAPRDLVGSARVVRPRVPPDLAGCWRNVNDPTELAALED